MEALVGDLLGHQVRGCGRAIGAREAQQQNAASGVRGGRPYAVGLPGPIAADRGVGELGGNPMGDEAAAGEARSEQRYQRKRECGTPPAAHGHTLDRARVPGALGSPQVAGAPATPGRGAVW